MRRLGAIAVVAVLVAAGVTLDGAWIEAANPGRHLTSHMFRKRAFTLAWEAGIDMRQASIAYGCNVDTLMKHYVAPDEQQVTDDVFAKMAKPKGA